MWWWCKAMIRLGTEWLSTTWASLEKSRWLEASGGPSFASLFPFPKLDDCTHYHRHWHYPPFRQQCHHHYQQHQHHRQPHQYLLITEYTKFVFNENIPPEGLEALEDKAIATWGDFIKIINRLDDLNHCQLLIYLLSISALLLWWPKSLSLIC